MHGTRPHLPTRLAHPHRPKRPRRSCPSCSTTPPPQTSTTTPTPTQPAPTPSPTPAPPPSLHIFHPQRTIPPWYVPFATFEALWWALRSALTPLLLEKLGGGAGSNNEDKVLQLEDAMASDPTNVQLFTQYMQELRKSEPLEAVLSFQSGRYAYKGDGPVKEYLTALVQSGQLNKYKYNSQIARHINKGSYKYNLKQLLKDLHNITNESTAKPRQQHATGATGAAAASSSTVVGAAENGSSTGSSDIGSTELSSGQGGLVGAGGIVGGSGQQPLYVQVMSNQGNGFRQGFEWLMGHVFALICIAAIWAVGVDYTRKTQAKESTSSSSQSQSNQYTPKQYNKQNQVNNNNIKTFDDVKGCDEAKEELQEIVQYLKYPAKFKQLKAKLPKGVLLTGPPGTGKTLLARAVAGEAGVPFLYRAGSEFEEMFVGVGARRVRQLFNAAKEKCPCIIFIDEIDAIGGSRKQWDNHRKTLNQFLTELDGFDSSDGIIVIGATNSFDILDTALIRPGRFDRHVHVNLPDKQGRREILDYYLKDKSTDANVNSEFIANQTPGFSGAQLYNLVNESLLLAVQQNKQAIDALIVDQVRDKLLMGKERRTLAQSPKCREMTAYHESGHALVALYTAGASGIHKLTVVPRGGSLGMLAQMPSLDSETHMTKQQLLASIDVAMGGKVAEELIYGNGQLTTGVVSDLQQATNTARQMITQCGMNDNIGSIYIDEHSSSATKQKVDMEIIKMLQESKQRVWKLLQSKQTELHRLSQALLDWETLTGDEVVQVCSGSFPGKATHTTTNTQETSEDVKEEQGGSQVVAVT